MQSKSKFNIYSEGEKTIVYHMTGNILFQLTFTASNRVGLLSELETKRPLTEA